MVRLSAACPRPVPEPEAVALATYWIPLSSPEIEPDAEMDSAYCSSVPQSAALEAGCA